MNKLLKSQLLVVSSVVGVTVLAGVGLVLSSTASAEAITDIINLTVSSSCNIVATGSTVHEVTVTSGLIKNAESTSDPISKSRITATCNDANGYSIYAIGFSNDIEGTTDMIAGDPLTSESNIATGNATTGNISNWGMKVIASTGTDAPTINTTDAGGSFATYRAVPTTYTKVASKASGVVTTNTSYIDTAYQVYVSTNQPAGSYSGKVKYVLVDPSTKDCPDGYSLNSGVCRDARKLSDINTMQEMTSAICANSAVNDTKKLKDERDNKSYQVTKLKDGNCWMTENLRFGGVNASDTPIAITSDNSDVASSFNLIASTPTGEAYTKETSWNNGAKSNKSEYYPDEENGYYYNWYAATAGTGNTDVTSGNVTGSICPKGWQLPVDSVSTEEDKSFARLFYMSGVIGANTNIGANTDVGYATGGETILTSAPLSFLLAGRHGSANASISNSGTEGDYWSASAASGTNAYLLFFKSTTNIFLRSNLNRNFGFLVRCVAR